MPAVTRFAPSPTGHLHLGHAYAAIRALQAAAGGGRFLVRIEDIDRQRCRADFERDLLEDLAWLGLVWEQPVRRQSDHLADYRAALARLFELGVVYPCFCSRKDIASAGGAPQQGDYEGPLYPGVCRTLSVAETAARIAEGYPHAVRLDVARALGLTGGLWWHDRAAGRQTAEPGLLGDVVLARRDAPTSYHLSVVVDDALQGVTLVTRGADLFAATHSHRLLQALLGLPSPEYHHHKLLVDGDGRRLSKRDGALTVRALRFSGHTAAEVGAMVGLS